MITAVCQTECPATLSPELEAALEYVDRGLPITLCRGKKPLGRDWTELSDGTEWHHHIWSVQEIERAFQVRSDLNVGVILGPRSGWIDIEADSPEQEQAFAKLFDGCDIPVTAMFQSPRGKHRLFAYDNRLAVTDKAVVDFHGLEIRIGAGNKAAQSLLPPSKSDDGTLRQWLVQLDQCDPMPLPDLVIDRIIEASGARRVYTENTEHTVDTEDSDNTAHTAHGLSTSVSSTSSVSTPEIDRIIAATLPSGPGHRNRGIFDFVRWLKSIPSLKHRTAKELRPLIRKWHDRALPFIDTKPFEETRSEFNRAWKNAKHPIGQGEIDRIFENAVKSARDNMPGFALQDYEQPAVRLLICLCRELQRKHGAEPFHLDVRTAGRLLKVSHTKAGQWLSLLVDDEVLRKCSQGTLKGHLASTYRYLHPV